MVRRLITNTGEALERQLSSIVSLPKIDAPYTTIVKRAQMTDLSNDLMPRMGVERIMVQNLVELPDETGPASDRVFGVLNDIHNRIRFVGNWVSNNDLDGVYAYAAAAASSTFMEITFYGTGLNILMNTLSGRDLRPTIDGGVEGANIVPASVSDPLGNRRHNVNALVPVTTTPLTLGFHTIKLRVNAADNYRITGFEILNEAATIKTTPGVAYNGGRKLSLASLNSQAYNSGFEATYGVAGVKGGHVAVYQKVDGTVGKAIRYTEASILTNTSTDHSNEELIRQYKYREFGAGRADDYSTLTTTPSDRAFILEDGTTSLASVSVVADITTLDNVDHGTSTTFTFVGTGLDIVGSTGTDTRFSIDGGADVVFPSGVSVKLLKVVSGLPYGTHTVKFTRPGSGLRISYLNVYGPKKPVIPSGAVELASYYLMADYVANTVTGLHTIATGVLRKHCTREMVYTGAWSPNSITPATAIGGFGIIANPGPGQTFRYTFFGTGFEYRFQTTSGVYNNTVSVDGSTNLSGFTTSIYQPHTLTFTAATGVIGGTGGAATPGAGIRVSGLALGMHTVVVTINNANALILDALDIITPIHSPKSNSPGAIQNTLSVGSNAIGDSREFGKVEELDIPNWAQAMGSITPGPTTNVTTLVPIPDMLATVKTKKGPLEITFNGTFRNSSAVENTFRVYVDGLAVGKAAAFRDGGTGANNVVTISTIVPVSPGAHTVQVYWAANGGGTLTAESDYRVLTVKEVE